MAKAAAVKVRRISYSVHPAVDYLQAIVANLHDVVIILGFFALFQWEFSLPVLAAVLAVLGYSVNESVVIADRIRENFRKMRKAAVSEIINGAITSTLSRTIITHGCTLMMVLSILFFGGETLHYFALALAIGICFGAYSCCWFAVVGFLPTLQVERLHFTQETAAIVTTLVTMVNTRSGTR